MEANDFIAQVGAHVIKRSNHHIRHLPPQAEAVEVSFWIDSSGLADM